MRWKCLCRYDGTDFNGWQSQSNGNTIQDFLERRLAIIFERPIRIHGAGRTDSGVHARGQIFHFDGDWSHGKEKLLRALQIGFPKTIQVASVQSVSQNFHARFSARRKRYDYSIYCGYAPPFLQRYCWSIGARLLNFDAMNEAAGHFLGTRNFAMFGANRGDGSADNPMKTIHRSQWNRRGKIYGFSTEGSGYLYKMVRRMVGCLVEIGLGKLPPEAIPLILAQQWTDYSIPTAPATGLSLERVFYR